VVLVRRTPQNSPDAVSPRFPDVFIWVALNVTAGVPFGVAPVVTVGAAATAAMLLPPVDRSTHVETEVPLGPQSAASNQRTPVRVLGYCDPIAGVGIDVVPATTTGCGRAPPDTLGVGMLVVPVTTAGETVVVVPTVGVGIAVDPATTAGVGRALPETVGVGMVVVAATTAGAGFALDVTVGVGIDVDPATTDGDAFADPLTVGVGMVVVAATTAGVAVAPLPDDAAGRMIRTPPMKATAAGCGSGYRTYCDTTGYPVTRTSGTRPGTPDRCPTPQVTR
jgi:hypothetical protein